MKLVNTTPYPADVFRMSIGDDRIAASVLARVTYDFSSGALVPSPEQPWIVSPVPWEAPDGAGAMDTDDVFYKGGVDVFVFGRAVAARGEPVKRMDVTVSIGSFIRKVVVFGDRVWRRQSGGGLAPSDPEPFTEMPLTLAFAFGGKDTYDGLEVAWPDNPHGKGFCVGPEEDSAVDRPLPNIEDPDHLIQHWSDHPDPAGVALCPRFMSARMRNGLILDDRGRISAIRPTFYNAAFPPMIAERVKPGDAIRITGVSAEGPLELVVPRHDLFVRARFGPEAREVPLAIDQVGIEVDKKRAFIAYRYPFRYVIVPLQRRSLELFQKA